MRQERDNTRNIEEEHEVDEIQHIFFQIITKW